jgi:hypothetical protein
MFKELDPTNDLTFLRIRTKVGTNLRPFLMLCVANSFDGISS